MIYAHATLVNKYYSSTCAFPNSKRLTFVRKSGREYHSGVSSFTSDRAEVHMSQLRATLLNSLSATSKVPAWPMNQNKARREMERGGWGWVGEETGSTQKNESCKKRGQR